MWLKRSTLLLVISVQFSCAVHSLTWCSSGSENSQCVSVCVCVEKLHRCVKVPHDSCLVYIPDNNQSGQAWKWCVSYSFKKQCGYREKAKNRDPVEALCYTVHVLSSKSKKDEAVCANVESIAIRLPLGVEAGLRESDQTGGGTAGGAGGEDARSLDARCFCTA